MRVLTPSAPQTNYFRSLARIYAANSRFSIDITTLADLVVSVVLGSLPFEGVRIRTLAALTSEAGKESSLPVEADLEPET